MWWHLCLFLNFMLVGNICLWNFLLNLIIKCHNLLLSRLCFLIIANLNSSIHLPLWSLSPHSITWEYFNFSLWFRWVVKIVVFNIPLKCEFEIQVILSKCFFLWTDDILKKYSSSFVSQTIECVCSWMCWFFCINHCWVWYF